jgi:lipid II isoglutaminyl synthase (glutamine-hydrolysing)
MRLVSYDAGHFNTNGDQGNLEILSAELRWRSIDFEVVSSTAPQDFEGADLVLFGGASRAVIEHHSQQLTTLLPVLRERVRELAPSIFIGSSFDFFAGPLFNLRAKPITRSSDYYLAEDGQRSVVGYLNTETDLPPLTVEGRQIGSLLTGPLLLKNRWLLNDVLRWLGVTSSLPDEKERAIQALLKQLP